MDQEQTKITFYAPKELQTQLKIIAAKNDTTVTSIVRKLVTDYVESERE